MDQGIIGAIGKTLVMVGAIIAATVPVIGWIIGGIMAIVGSIMSMFSKPRVPNFWMNNYNPDQTGAAYKYNPEAPEYTHTGNKDAHIGRETPFGMLVISSHEMSMTVDKMREQFGKLLDNVVDADVALHNTIMRVDEALGTAGKTMDYFNNLLGDNAPGVTSVSTNQKASELNTGDMLQERYAWIVDKLAESDTKVGQYINAWFDTLTGKFLDVSKDNSMMVVGVINMLADNMDSLMKFPLEIVDLIGQSVKSISAGGTPESIGKEISEVFNAFLTVQVGLATLGMTVDDKRVISFLAGINAIGYGVQDAAVNLVAYGIALKNISGELSVTGDELMASVEAKMTSLKSQGMDTTEITAFFGSFGLMSKMFSEAGVSFSEIDLDNVANSLHNLAKGSVEIARETINHLIATEKLTDVTR